ncbi:MAG: hypothetical protein VCC04_07005 [Myxococcota bacterium]
MSRTGWIALIAGALGLGLAAAFWLPGTFVPGEENAFPPPGPQAEDRPGAMAPAESALEEDSVTAVAPPREKRGAAMRRRRAEAGRPIPAPGERGRALVEQAERRKAPPSSWKFNRTLLERAGYGPEEIDRLQQQFEQALAVVSNSAGQNRFPSGYVLSDKQSADLLTESKLALIDALEPEDISAILYAYGQTNRVLLGAPQKRARSLRLKPEDQLWAYGDPPERIYIPDQYLALMHRDRDLKVDAQIIFKRGDRFITVTAPHGVFGAPFRGQWWPPDRE